MKKSSHKNATPPNPRQLIQPIENLETVMSLDSKREIVQAATPIPSELISLLHLEFAIILSVHLVILWLLKQR